MSGMGIPGVPREAQPMPAGIPLSIAPASILMFMPVM
jgi:hypothetical protein